MILLIAKIQALKKLPLNALVEKKKSHLAGSNSGVIICRNAERFEICIGRHC